MRTKNLLKVTLAALAVFVFVGVQAQTINHSDDPATGTNYVEAGTLGDATTYQTVNLGFRLYVLPDPVYSPNYDGTGNVGTNLGTNSLWRWVSGASYAAGAEVKAAANENWIQIFPTATGTTTYWVLETHGLISCEGGAQDHIVTVVDEPSITTFTGQGNGWDIITPGIDYRRCAEGADIGDILDIAIAEAGAPAAANNYTYGISVEREALDFNLDPVIPSTITPMPGLGKAIDTGNLDGGLNQTFTVGDLELIDASTPTQYRFTIAANSLHSMISMRSQLRAGVATAGYPVPATTVTYTILPVPTTGPIFHIPNAF